MKPDQKQQQKAHSNWVASLNDAYASCRQALLQASVDVSDPKRALWPAVPRGQMTTEHQTVAKCHATALDYAQHIEPFQNRCAGKWTEEVAPDHTFPDGNKLPVVLSELERWSGRRYREPVGTTHELTGRATEQKIRRVHLPVAYARKVVRQVNACREQLKLLADPPTPERTVDGPGDAW